MNRWGNNLRDIRRLERSNQEYLNLFIYSRENIININIIKIADESIGYLSMT